MIDLDTLQLRSVVNTPVGPGVYQGKIEKNGKVVSLLVSHPSWKRHGGLPITGKHHNTWWLVAHPVEQVSPYEYANNEQRETQWNNKPSQPPIE